jgi:succinate dehydrogenase/fumarate reductase flavoprotein subunit
VTSEGIATDVRERSMHELPGSFDLVTDVVVIGFGMSGAVSAITASDAGADVTLMEKMNFPGGISICSGGGIRYSDDAEQTFRYLRATNDGRTPDEILRAFAEQMVGLDGYIRWLAKPSRARVITEARRGNYPFEGFEHIPTVRIESVPGFDAEIDYPFVRGRQGVNLFKILHDHVRSRKIDIRMGYAAERLIRSNSGEVVGVIARLADGSKVQIGARRAVILSCGGFEASSDMQAQFWEGGARPNSATRANTGDGIRMAQELGADLWHMWHYHGSYGFRHPDLPFAIRVKKLPDWIPGKSDPSVKMSWILIGRKGRRFMNEYDPYLQDTSQRVFSRFDPQTQDFPNIPAWMVVDQDGLNLYPLGHAVYNDDQSGYFQWSKDNQAEIDLGIIRKYETIEDLAEGVGLSEVTLYETLAEWNGCVARGKDDDFGRPPGSMMSIQKAPFYAAQVWPFVTNTQGGPVHDASQRVLDVFGKPIPRLYEAGELGSIWGHLYLSGANLTECIITGRTAGQQAAALPSTVLRL